MPKTTAVPNKNLVAIKPAGLLKYGARNRNGNKTHQGGDQIIAGRKTTPDGVWNIFLSPRVKCRYPDRTQDGKQPNDGRHKDKCGLRSERDDPGDQQQASGHQRSQTKSADISLFIANPRDPGGDK